MPNVLNVKASNSETVLADFFGRFAPILVEVRYPGMACSPDWHLLEEEKELEAILEKLGPGVELYLHSVWDLKDLKEPLTLKK